jgi:hypothetical protein
MGGTATGTTGSHRSKIEKLDESTISKKPHTQSTNKRKSVRSTTDRKIPYEAIREFTSKYGIDWRNFFELNAEYVGLLKLSGIEDAERYSDGKEPIHNF